jgi:hypothetical protein
MVITATTVYPWDPSDVEWELVHSLLPPPAGAALA